MFGKNPNDSNLEQTVAVALRYGYRLSLQLHKIAGLP
jgi:organic radical activating enzyme